ncbi:hypothetical protein NSA50_02145 [Clostridium sp. DSM 100503]|uniref:hypothetical protein n=1 Tax=Clostridium sp. DSM 100503 TaxID=2963282 RepID=UPI00214A0986|nr:hypothetical protein [Clostridium sp. DSM 100503]MCR1949859.1 hypothetical protein [Clostridium sp. DSM 100503]
MEKFNIKLKSRIKKLWLGFLILFVIINFILRPLGYKILIYKVSPSFFSYILILGLIYLIILFDFKKHKWIKGAYSMFAIIFILSSILFYMLFYSETKYFTFKSPNKNNTLVVEEKAFLLSGYSNFYERKFGIFIKSLNECISTDDGFRPFSNNQYKITWVDNNTIKLEYDFGSLGIWKVEFIDLD